MKTKADIQPSAPLRTEQSGAAADPARKPGRLRLFLGYAPGMVKTGRMLERALDRADRGDAVVVCALREDLDSSTRALAERLEQIACIADGGGLALEAVITRRPKLVVVDELAHRGGGRSRWEDVQRILAVGIDVYATVNVAHLDSTARLIERQFGVKITTPLPETVLERADSIEVVDVDPEDLAERYHRGEIGAVHLAGIADPTPLFRPTVLATLREELLRRASRRALPEDKRHESIGPGGILVVLEPGVDGDALVRAGHHTAERAGVELIVIEVIDSQRRPGRSERARMWRSLRLARRLGASIDKLEGSNPVSEVRRFAVAQGISEVVVAKASGVLSRLRATSIAQGLMDSPAEFSLHVIDARTDAPPPYRLEWRNRSDQPWFHGYLVSTVAVFGCAGFAKLIESFLTVTSLPLVMIIAVLYAASAFGLAAAIYASILNTVVFNYFFLPPKFNFRLDNPDNVVTISVFLATAILVSKLAGDLLSQARAARQREQRTAAMFRLSRELSAVDQRANMARVIVDEVRAILGLQSVLLLPGDGTNPTLHAVWPSDIPMGSDDRAAAAKAFNTSIQTGRGTANAPNANRLYQPLRTAGRTVGVLGLEGGADEDFRDPAFRDFLTVLSDLVAVAVERVRLAEETTQARLVAETESLRSALLSSVSHDLRTPLASVIGSASSLLGFGHSFDVETSRDLLETIYEEARRLDRFVGNILDVTKLEAGVMEVNRQWMDVEDIVETGLDGIGRRLENHEVTIDVAPDVPLLYVDAMLMKQVLVNVLENAAKYSPERSSIVVRSYRNGDKEVVIEVVDSGVGLAAKDIEQIFDKFYRVRERDRRIAGTGLGLSIVRAIVEHHGGRVSVVSEGLGKGSRFRVHLPIEEPPTTLSGEDEGDV